MRTTIVAMLVASGTMITLPALAQQQPAPNPQMQEEADKGAKTRQSGESGYVGEQEKPGASARPPGKTRLYSADNGLSHRHLDRGDRQR